jgi:hypothetical protein
VKYRAFDILGSSVTVCAALGALIGGFTVEQPLGPMLGAVAGSALALIACVLWI